MKVEIIDLHPIIEGEGLLMGVPMIMIRTSGCNLSCMFDNSICDTAYSSFKPEKGKFSLEDVDEMINSHPQINWISLSGGEPTLYPEFISYLKDKYPDHLLLVETNGTLVLDEKILKKIDFASISPKLSGSVPTKEKCEKLGLEWKEKMNVHDTLRFNDESLVKIVKYVDDFQFKFAVSNEEDIKEATKIWNQVALFDFLLSRKSKEEALKTIDKILKTSELPKDFTSKVTKSRVWLMPTGITEDQLSEKRKWLMETCIKEGYNYSDRLHIVAYGNEREK